MNSLPFVALLLLLCASECQAQWRRQTAPTAADFRGLSVVGPKVAWVGGTKGTVLHTANGGETWLQAAVPGAEKLDFRDVEGFSERTAYALSAGPGEQSRIYKTIDGGNIWALQFTNHEPEGFIDAIAFWDERNGIALGDPVRGSFQLIVTEDGGDHWRILPANALPPALQNEGAFAASGTCLATHGANDVWFATGGAKVARVFHSSDRGRTWTVGETPIVAGAPSAGIFSIAFRDPTHGVIVGGDYRKPHEPVAAVATTSDGGKAWTLTSASIPYRCCAAWAKDRWIAVGTSGSDYSIDDGKTWSPHDRENYNSVGFAANGEGWAVGPKGRIAKFVR
jgi:photosystem II stability/assembly factor-like uncharacterized protein